MESGPTRVDERIGPILIQELTSLFYFLGSAGLLVSGGEDISPLSLQATRHVALISATSR
jgi:hypothetical protein